MICLARVDDRLVHGQVTVGWVPVLKPTVILVVNDRVAADPVLAAIARTGGVSGSAIEIVAVAAAGAWCRERAGDADRVLLLFESCGDARRSSEAGLSFPVLSLGGIRHRDPVLCLHDAVCLSRDDIEDLRSLRARGVRVELRMMPGDTAVEYRGEAPP